jgi:hypothetical protein
MVELNLQESSSSISGIPTSPNTTFSLMGIDDEVIVQANLLSTTEGSPRLGLSQHSSFYQSFPNGFMLVPGRLGANFNDDMRMSFVVNPQDPGRFCQEGSLFYANAGSVRGVGDFMLKAKLRQEGEYLNTDYTWHRVVPNFEKVDEIPWEVAPALIRRIRAVSAFATSECQPSLFSPSRLVYMVNDCDLATGRNEHNYPSIEFEIYQQTEHMQPPIRTGSIVYDPVDYLEPFSDSQCRFRVGRGFRFGPQFLSSIAVHFTVGRIGFCDPVDQE